MTAFSFLYRNERTATRRHVRAVDGISRFQFPLSERTNCNAQRDTMTGVLNEVFQFPLSERTNCNRSDEKVDEQTSELSVSSIGTNELQLLSRPFGIRKLQTFSFLYRNERTATQLPSVTRDARTVFQFPLSERTNCNVVRFMRCNRDFPTFSFLYRNERTATSTIYSVSKMPRAFSFLYRNERTATSRPKLPRAPRSCAFSFLYRNERTATKINELISALDETTFSFLYRNERTATSTFFSCESLSIRSFSFLYRNERTATRLERARCRHPSQLSVSSIGTNELQQP